MDSGKDKDSMIATTSRRKRLSQRLSTTSNFDATSSISGPSKYESAIENVRYENNFRSKSLSKERFKEESLPENAALDKFPWDDKIG